MKIIRPRPVLKNEQRVRLDIPKDCDGMWFGNIIGKDPLIMILGGFSVTIEHDGNTVMSINYGKYIEGHEIINETLFFVDSTPHKKVEIPVAPGNTIFAVLHLHPNSEKYSEAQCELEVWY